MNKRIVFFILLHFCGFLPGSFLESVSRANPAPGFESFWTEFKSAVERGDRGKLASMIQYPLENTLPELAAKDRQEFLGKYPKIFSAQARPAILKAKPDFIAEEGIYSLHYCAKPGECYLMSFKRSQAGQSFKLNYLGPYGE